jgi:glucosamine 6-phosphate synthetase-like amidotransferase/phosphosugar isomerase protein
MCNLNFLIKTIDKKKADTQSDLLNAYNSACFNSFISNNDNEGFYFDFKKSIITSDNKINLFDSQFLFNNSNFILGHQRYSTSGYSLEFAQPFKKNDFVFIHNGVISDYAKNGNSDTYNLFNAFLKHFNRYLKTMKRKIAIKKAIEKILKNKSGSFSIGIFDIKENALFYFKNESTLIYAVKNKDNSMLYLTTALKNLDFLEIANKDLKRLEIEDNILYKIGITQKNKISFKSLGALNFDKKKADTQSENYYKSYNHEISHFNNIYNDSELLTLEFLKKEYDIKKSSIAFLCENCKTPTFNDGGNYGGIFCDDCLKEFEYLRIEEEFDNKKTYFS